MNFSGFSFQSHWRTQLRLSAIAVFVVSFLPPFLVLLLGVALYSMGIGVVIWFCPPLLALVVAHKATSRSWLVVLLMVVNVMMAITIVVYDFGAVKEALERNKRMRAHDKNIKEAVFREAILNPIPGSVKKIEMKGSPSSTFRLTFDISHEDFQTILRARSYEKVSDANPNFTGMSIYKYSKNKGHIKYVIMVNQEESQVIFDRIYE